MNIKKTVAATAIGGALILGLAACGSAETTSTQTAPTSAAPSNATPTASATPAPDVSATPTPVVDNSGTEAISVPSGGFFYLPTPKGFSDNYMRGYNDALDIEQDYDPALVGPAPYDLVKIPADAVKPPSINGTTDALLWKVADGASGTANITMSYTNPKTGETVDSALVVNIK